MEEQWHNGFDCPLVGGEVLCVERSGVLFVCECGDKSKDLGRRRVFTCQPGCRVGGGEEN